MTPHAIIALHAIMNRIMTDSQRRAVFAKMREGGGGRQGGPVKPNLPKEGGGRKILPIKPNLPQQPGGPKVTLVDKTAAPGPNYYTATVIRNPDGSIGRKFPEVGFPGFPSDRKFLDPRPEVMPREGGEYLPFPVAQESTNGAEITERVPGYGTPPEKRGGMRTMEFRDKDKDGVDDRDQDGPGMPKYDSPAKARPPAGAGGAQPLPTPPPSGNPKMPSPPRTGGPKMPNLPSPPRGYTPGDMQFFTTTPRIGADGYITGPNGKKFTPKTYKDARDTYERRVRQDERLKMQLLDGIERQQSYGRTNK